MTPAARRRGVLIALLAATLVAAFYRSGEESAADTRTQLPAPRVDRSIAPVLTESPTPSAATPPAVVIPPPLQPRHFDEKALDAFAVKSWAPPPAPPPPPPKIVARPMMATPPVPPPPPRAPALPFKYLGRFEEQGVVTVFLAAGERNLLVKAGQTLEGSYRLDGIQGNTLTFTYLPLQQQQTLAVVP